MFLKGDRLAGADSVCAVESPGSELLGCWTLTITVGEKVVLSFLSFEGFLERCVNQHDRYFK